ncbi:MAG: AAA family ATPase [Sedimentisphaerales bacterium]|nr:AAA family ATPase [Sedimentisphaerales bacterium]
MKLRRMRVKNFRCVEDSTEFSVCPVTAFVGKNGAGKTSLLEALYKLNPDVEELARFDVLMEYPRARRREYQKQPGRQPDEALIATWELEDRDVEKLESVLGAGAVTSRTVVVEKGYYPGRRWTGSFAAIDAMPAPSPTDEGIPRQTHDAEPPSDGSGMSEEPVRGLTRITDTGEETGTATFGERQTPIDSSSQSTQGPRAELPHDPNVFLERRLAPLLPKFLYFSEWHIMDGRISIDALLQRKTKGELTGPDRVFLALLELGGTSVEALTGIERSEELIADLEDAARPITAEIARYWSQERDLRVSFHLYPARPGDPSPLDRGLVFETRIVNTRTDLSLNFSERSTGFVWFFSFLVWYADVRRRCGDNLIILLDDPGLGLHAKAQWDLLRYVRERLVSQYQVLYATHSPFMIDPERMEWVRTVEEVTHRTPDGRSEYLGTKVGDEVLSMDHDTLLPLQASLGYRIMQDLTAQKRLLLVEKPADVLYLQWFSARLNERGRTGLRPAWTIVPCGDLVRLAALAGLLANDASGFAVLLTLSEVRPEITEHREVSRMLQRCHVFPLHKYAKPAASTVEDLLGWWTYLALTDESYGLPRKYRLSRTMEQVTGDEPVLKMVRSTFAARQIKPVNFDPMIPAEYLFRSKHRKIEKLPGASEAFARFETLFTSVNDIL